MKPANYGPFYAAGLYPNLAETFRAHGYALAVHGSLANDFDLIAVPWIEGADDPQVVIEKIRASYGSKFAARDNEPAIPTMKPHGRVAYKVHLSFGVCSFDVSFTPRIQPAPEALR